MAKSKIEQLKQDLDNAFLPLKTRRDNYFKALIDLRTKLHDYFLTDKSPPSVRSGIETCLIAISDLGERAASLQSQTTQRLSITAALDYQVKESRLLLKACDKGYETILDASGLAELKSFMQQFASALSIYRVHLKIYEMYCFNFDFLRVDAQEACLENAQALGDKLQQSAYDIYELFYAAKDNACAIKALFSEIRVQEEPFDLAMKLQGSDLTRQFELAAQLIQDCYRNHPNWSFLFFAMDSDWQRLLKGIAAALYDNQYTYSSYSGTLTIEPLFISTMGKEITQFYGVICEKQIVYRAELLGKALTLTSDVIARLRVEAAKADVSLIKPQEKATAPSTGWHSLYAYYSQFDQSPAPLPASDGEPYSFH